MVLDIILITVGLLGLIIASISDLKTREVPDLLNYGLIFIGASIRLLDAIIFNNWKTLLITLAGFVVVFIVANLMYYSKQWGGGDAKLLMALAIIFPQYPPILLKLFTPNLGSFPFLLTLFINILLIGSLYGLAYSFYLSLKNKKSVYKEMKIISKTRYMSILRWVSLFAALSLVAILTMLGISIFSPLSIAILLVILFYPYLLTYIKSIEKSTMYKHLEISKLTEGDWVASDIIINGKKIYKSSSPGINKRQIQLLKASRLKKILVKEGIPFVPSFLLATIFTLIFGSPLPI